MAASANPILADRTARDPHLFCTAYKRQRFYLFTRSEPEYAHFLANAITVHLMAITGILNLATAMSSMNDRLERNKALLPLPPRPQTKGHRLLPIRPPSTLPSVTFIFAYFPRKHRKRWRTLLATLAAVTLRVSSSIVSFRSS